MAGNETSVSGQTDLLTGWSCVVHRPSEDPEPSSLPSTVDIAAFSSGPSVAPSQSIQNDCCSNSDSDSASDSENSVSDASGSCSYSSTDTDSSSSSQASSSSSIPPQFSVTSSQTGGLRLTIATVRKSCSSPSPKEDSQEKTEKAPSGEEPKPAKVADSNDNSINTVIKNLPKPKLSSSDSDSEGSGSESSSNPESRASEKKLGTAKRESPAVGRVKCLRKVNNKTSKQSDSKVESVKKTVRSKDTPSKVPPKVAVRSRGRPPGRTNKMASLPLARVQSPHATSSDSEDSVSDSDSAMLASCSLQEIRQEDLAAILPDQQDCDAFGGFECEARAEKAEVDVGDASGSDMELPTQLVNAAIQRVTTESSSETDSQPAIYASTLLQQFVQQAQLLNNSGTSGSTINNSSDNPDKQSSTGNAADAQSSDKPNGENVKRKRGRPKKNITKKSTEMRTDTSQHSSTNNLLNAEYCGEPNVSPDSGIQNSPDHLSSPEPSPSPNVRLKPDQDKIKSSKSNSTEACLHDRKVKSSSKTSSSSIGNNKSSKKEIVIQKVAQKQKMALTCNNLDRVLYANSDRVLYPPRRKVGRPAGKLIRKPGRPPKSTSLSSSSKLTVSSVKTDSSRKVQSSSSKNISKNAHKGEKRRKKKRSNKPPNDNDIVQLTSNTLSLSLGKQSDLKKSDISSNVNSVPKKIKPSGALLNEICERVSKRLELSNKYPQTSTKPVLQSTANEENASKPNHSKEQTKNEKPPQRPKCVAVIKNKTKLNIFKSRLNTFKHMKVMHTKHCQKHKKHKIKILKTLASDTPVPAKIDPDIDKLINDFVKYCNLGTSKSQKENCPEIFRCVKKLSKKRKGLEASDGRKKKKQTSVNNGESKETNSNEQRLPLKKRHYHMSASNESKTISTNSSTINESTKEKDELLTKQNGDIKTKTVVNPKIIQKNDNIKPDSPPNKSPSHTVTANNNNKSVLVMNHKTPPVSKSSTNTNNNIYNNRKPAESEDLIGSHIDEAIEACITKYSSSKTIASNTSKQQEVEQKPVPVEVKKSVTSMTATTPKKRHRLETENIENYNTQVIDKVTKKLETSVNNLKLTETSLVENKPNVTENISEVKNNKKSLPSAPSPDPLNNNKKYNDKKIETVAQMITRKKNRLEDLTSNLVSKINPTLASPVDETPTVTTPAIKKPSKKTEEEIVPEMVTRASVIKSPMIKKVKSSDTDKLLDSIVEDKPTGIFMQTVDLELHIPTTTVKTVQDDSSAVEKSETSNNQHNLRNKKVQEPVETEVVDSKPIKKTKLLKDVIVQVEKLKPSELPVEKCPIIVEKNATPGNIDLNNKTSTVLVKKKVRRRKAINRTGFPTLKKKKKKVVNVVTKPVKTENDIDSNIYDRVPRLGEEASTFMKRTQDCKLSVVALEKLQTKPETISTPSEADLISKWEISSECDSLPMDECTFTSELDAGKLIKMEKLDIKHERMSLRLRDVSPSTSVETRFSDRVRKMTRDSTPDTKICTHRTRESSVGSVQTLPDDSERNFKRKRDYSSDKIDKKKRLYDLDYLKYSKKRFRDVSPSSSIEPLPSDKKQRSDSVASSSGDDFKRSKKIPRWRKKYLLAGLFSDYYKEDDESARARRESACTKTKLVYNPSEHPYGLLPPPYHCGKYLRCRKIPFKLPYDLWWQHTHSQLPGRDMVPSWNYRKIRTNVYCVRNTSGACEPQACNCTSTSRCEDDCINRLVLAECPSTHRCRNQRIQKHEWAPGLEKFMTENKGWGVRTKLSIKTGEFILEYVGEVVSDQEFKHRMATRYAHDTHHYCLHLDGGLVIDGHRMGGDGRFVNHSCQPNCEIQKWSVNGQFRMALFALRDITADEELTYDYNFSLFNAAEGQVCKCGSDNCRGVIGGKSQRVRQSGITQSQSIVETNNNQPGRVGRPRKNQARKAPTNGPTKEVPVATNIPQPIPIIIAPHVKPMSHQQKCFALQHHCFLLRNLNKVKRLRERPVASISRVQTQTPVENSNVFINQFNALRQPRNMRTRRLAQVEDNPELNKAAKLASILKDLYEAVTTAKDENKSLLCTPFMTLPSKRKHPDYYQRILDPIDLNTIEQNIATGIYRTVKAFDTDMIKLFTNSVRFFGRTSELGISATRLRKVYGQGKIDYLSRLEDVLGEKAPANFVSGKDPGDEEEDVIRCICGLYRDEGLMIQCERCLVWQHCECVRANPDAASYHCERCVPRKVDLEIPLDEYNEDGHRYFVSLLRGDLQLRQSDTVYVLRDIPIPGTDKKHTYDTVGDVNYTDLDIFRIERMWKDSKTGQRFAFGHHYLRPHETYHEPTRKFFPNEVMRVPLYEVVPIELIMSPCWVLDVNTYCKGRPFSASEEHVYICEYRVDKTARLFSKISKSKYPVCTKSYAFDRFDVRLKISRTFTPHELNNVQVKPRGRRPHDAEEQSTSKEILTQVVQEVPVIRIRSREEQRAHLNSILLRLLGRLPTKQTLDVSYLLEGGRRRKKQQS